MDEEDFGALREDLLRLATRAGAGYEAEDLVHDCMIAMLRASPRDGRAYAFGALYRRIALHWRQTTRRMRRDPALDAAELLTSDTGDEVLFRVLRLDGALALVADGGDSLRLVVMGHEASRWASDVVDAVGSLLAGIGDRSGYTQRHIRRIRAQLMETLCARASDVVVELTDSAGPDDGVRITRGADRAVDLADLARRCSAIRLRSCRDAPQS